MAFLTLVIMLVGNVVFIFGFGSIIYIARQDVERETDSKVQQSVALIHTYVDGQLQRVEDVAYTLISNTFANTVRNEDGDAMVNINQATLRIPSEEKVFQNLESFIDANPFICGVAIGFEPFLYKFTKGQYGFAAYVTNVSGKNERLPLGEIHDYRQKEWYRGAYASNAPYWSHPFRETSQGKVVACFSIPLHGYGNRIVGVLALDIDTEAFRDKCNEVSPFPGAEVSLVDADYRFIANSNESYILKKISEIEKYSSYQAEDSLRAKMMRDKSGQAVVNRGTDHEAMFYFSHIDRTGWTISIECPKDEIYGNVTHMRKVTRVIALLCMLFMIVCFVLVFRKIDEETQKKASLDRDLQIASAIQTGMLPKEYPAFPDRKDIDVYGFLQPAKFVGGDLYDYLIRDDKLFFAVGDVSGKGVPASLFMAVLRALFRNVSQHTDSPSEIISALNTAICEKNSMSMFCTMFLGILDLKTGTLKYCNAGHNAPVIRRIGEDGLSVEYMKPKTNLALGVFNEFPYQMETTSFAHGEAIFLYTDGVTESENEKKELLGDQGLLDALSAARHHNMRSSKEFVDFIYDAIKKHANGYEQNDDITMMVVDYRG